MRMASTPSPISRRRVPAVRPDRGHAAGGSIRQNTKVSARNTSPYLWLVVALLYSLIIPREVRFQIGDLVFYLDRIVLFAALPFAFYEVMRSRVTFIFVDALVLGIGGLMIFSIIMNYDVATGLERGGAVALDTAMPYLIARIFVTSHDTLRRALILFAPGLIIAAGIVALESVTSTPIARPLAERLFGPLQHYVSGEAAGNFVFEAEYRAGLMRASGPFQHPILAGLFLASVLPLYSMGGLRGWPRLSGVLAAFGSFFSLSSAALLALVMALGFAFYKWLQEVVEFLSWKLAMIAIALAAIGIQLISSGGLLKFVIRNLTLNSQTGYFRLLIWEFGSASVAQNPLFGIGFRAYERPNWIVTDTVDAHWLLLALRFGLPVAIGLGSVVLFAVASASLRSQHMARGDRDLSRAIAMSIVMVALMAFTVALFGTIGTWFMFLLGLAFCQSPSTHPARKTV